MPSLSQDYGSTSSSPKSPAVDIEVEDISDDELAPGAPVEKTNPLGREVTLTSAVMLNLGQLLGSGIFSVPGVILNSVGSVGLLLSFWIIAPVFAFVALFVYTELSSLFPHRAGAEVVYLEQAYPRPRFLVPITFAVTSVLTSFSATNSVVFAQYVLSLFDIPVTGFRQTTIAIAMVTFSVGGTTYHHMFPSFFSLQSSRWPFLEVVPSGCEPPNCFQSRVSSIVSPATRLIFFLVHC